LTRALGPLSEAINAGHMYVTLSRLEKAGLIQRSAVDGSSERLERKVYALTAAGQERVAEWLGEVSWPKPDLAEFHLKLIAAVDELFRQLLVVLDQTVGQVHRLPLRRGSGQGQPARSMEVNAVGCRLPVATHDDGIDQDLFWTTAARL
jgi:DNA-binding PadR family transcriptional regulator